MIKTVFFLKNKLQSQHAKASDAPLDASEDASSGFISLADLLPKDYDKRSNPPRVKEGKNISFNQYFRFCIMKKIVFPEKS